MTNENNAAVADTILQQLGGHRFRCMTGAKNFLAGDAALIFTLPRFAGVKVNKVVVTLDADDTYTVNFYRLTKRGLNCETLATVAGVYGDNLRDVFTAKTGLLTAL